MAVVFCNVWLIMATREFIASDAKSATANEVGLVLGTSKALADGSENKHFTNRMRMAAELYKRGKVKHLLVSGDNGSKYYNEPKAMRAKLEELGVPSEAITRDFAGFRTLDSMFRAKDVFQLDSLTVISDNFHLPRAIYIGRHYGLNVTGVASKRVPLTQSFRTECREWLARVKAVLDLYLLDTDPRFRGKPEPIIVSR